MPISHFVEARLDSVQVLDADGELEGYALTEDAVTKSRDRARVGAAVLLTPVRCCRTCAWADAELITHRAGTGLVYTAA